jgi:hypothetical protein
MNEVLRVFERHDADPQLVLGVVTNLTLELFMPMPESPRAAAEECVRYYQSVVKATTS